MQEEKLAKIPQLINEVEKVILGKSDVLQMTVAAFLAGGHVLFEDIPGVGKTLMVKTLAKTIQGTFSRVQFTPDLLPSDILGVSIFNSHTNEFEFRPGPIFTTVLLADEINRATPRTQAALLEAMSENRVTIDNHTYQLPDNFFVLATQNPIDYEGTYPLPEAQLDRFLFRLNIGYPEFDDEMRLILGKPQSENSVQELLDEKEVSELKELVDEVFVHESVARYGLQLVEKTRNHPAIALGISPRGSIAFIRGAKAFALTQGRAFVTPEDLQKVLPAVFGHRLKLKSGGHSSDEVKKLMQEITSSVPVPIRR
ncbi:MAG TPA: MoxR family ATPase [Candidatus Tetragenococcus pullicola]|nr:MoxR family ATPase [Candidatus Tetragenococcus pullicola]